MNEIEKKAFEVLGEGAKEKIAGGIKESDELTEKQCSELKDAVSQLSEEEQLAIAGGKKQLPGTKKIKKTTKEDKIKINLKDPTEGPLLIKYGGPGFYTPVDDQFK